MEEKKIFVPHELKTIEVDVEKKIFRVNGEDFGKGCTGFQIFCNANHTKDNGMYSVYMEIESNIRFLGDYDADGKMMSKEERHPKESDAAND